VAFWEGLALHTQLFTILAVDLCSGSGARLPRKKFPQAEALASTNHHSAKTHPELTHLEKSGSPFCFLKAAWQVPIGTLFFLPVLKV
jgi:hypothetical protein